MIRRIRNAGQGFSDGALEARRVAFLEPEFGREVAREFIEGASHVAQRGGRGGSGGGRRGKGSDPAEGLLSDDELREIEAAYADGITAAQVVDIFVSRHVRFSEATFRKYVQQGLLPRSKRVGRKGKHRGSLGVYPAKTIRRVNDIKRLMTENYTIEEIERQFLRFAGLIENIEEGFAELAAGLEEEIDAERVNAKARRGLKRELRDARKVADDLIRSLESLASQVAGPRGDQYRTSGAPGSAEELL